MAVAARKIGIATQVWTVNDPTAARTLWSGGVAGIVTDDPAAILRAREQ
jgi:glycerophosphoryl diester phosphodiesterase